ncbi:MAG: phosphotransferase family protein [Chloroflexia bacterium]
MNTEQITPEWLTSALREAGHLECGRVVSVRAASSRPFEKLVTHIEVGYSPDAHPAAPAQLFLKRDPGPREAEFYDKIAPLMHDPPVPSSYASGTDAHGDYLLLEYIPAGTHRSVEMYGPPTRPDSERMLDVLAWIHAAWWDDPRLGCEIGSPSDAESMLAEYRYLSDHFGEFVDFFGDRISPERRRIYERVLAALPPLLVRRLAEAHLTLAHNDAHAWNFLLPRDPAGKTYLFDWDLWTISPGPLDVSNLIARFWYPERRAAMEMDLLRGYHARLLALGVSGYTWDACLHDYRFGVVRHLVKPLGACIYKGWSPHRWAQLEVTMLSFQDLKCEELLDA